jgi:hypothetical protein
MTRFDDVIFLTHIFCDPLRRSISKPHAARQIAGYADERTLAEAYIKGRVIGQWRRLPSDRCGRASEKDPRESSSRFRLRVALQDPAIEPPHPRPGIDGLHDVVIATGHDSIRCRRVYCDRQENDRRVHVTGERAYRAA